MGKDKKLYVVVSFALLLAIAGVVLACGVSLRTVIMFGLGVLGWSILAIYKAQKVSKRRKATNIQHTTGENTNRRRMMRIERIASSLILAFSAVSLVRGLVIDQPLYAVLEAAFVIV